MRKGIDYIGVGVGAVILNDEDKFFLAKRGNDTRNERHKWEFPGGSVEFGEKINDAVRREILEEYAFLIRVERLIDVVDHIIPHENQHGVSPTFLCRFRSGVPRIREPHKCEQIAWFSLPEIPAADLTIASQKSLEHYINLRSHC